MSARPDPELDAFLRDVAASVEDDLRVDGGCPDLAAVVALAHRLDPEAVPQAAVQEVSAWAPVVTLREGRRRRATRDDPEMLSLLSDVRAQVEQEVALRFAIGSSPAPQAPATEGTAANVVPLAPRRVWVGVLAAAAALMLVAGGVIGGVLVTRDEAQPLPQSAIHQDPPAGSERSTVRDAAEPPGKVSPREAPSPETAPSIETEDETLLEPADAPSGEDARDRKRATPRRAKPAPAVAPAPTLDELDARAHAAWKDGDLAGAEAAFREIVKRAGKGKLADLAYGDLFTLARQSKKPGREAALWREYLEAFPRGRFADDARAGLCRRAEGDERSACWTAYLEAMPEGSHRAQAERELRAK
jgi:hypothetical protein